MKAQEAVGKLCSAVALMAGLVVGVKPAQAVTTITWTNKATTGSANLSWNTAGNWDTAPAWSGTEDALCGVFSTATLASTLDGDRKVNSLSLGGGYAFTLAAGSAAGSKLILTSGNLTSTNSAGYGSLGAPIQVGDGTTPVPNAVWFFNGGAAQQTLNRILGVAGTVITLTNKSTVFWPAFLANNATNYFGDWVLCGGPVQARADNALGLGRITMQNAAAIYNGVAGSQNTGASVILSNDIVVTGATVQFGVWTNTATPMTLAGNLSGTGIVAGASSDRFYGVLKIAGTNNSASGGFIFNKVINPEGLQIVLVGTWTNAGTFDLAVQYGPGASLQGNGFLGLGMNKKVTMAISATYPKSMFIAPSDGTPIYNTGNPLLLTNGTIGTLTIGTPGNSNSVEFTSNSWLVVKVNTTTGSTLVVNGLLNMNFTSNSLAINGTLASSRTYTLAHFTSRSNKFANVYWNTIPVVNAESNKAINGTHKLVYSSTDLLLAGSSVTGTALLFR